MTREELREATALLRSFLARYRKHLGRREVQALVETYVTGLLSDIRKRNAEAMALEIGEGRVRALQRVLVSAEWDEVLLLPAIQATGRWLLPRRDCLPLNAPASAGRTSGRATRPVGHTSQMRVFGDVNPRLMRILGWADRSSTTAASLSAFS